MVAFLSISPSVRPSIGQSPRAANPERPTVATHAYAVTPGYVELEQGLRWSGVRRIAEGTTWEFNLKVGVVPSVQLGFFGTGYARTALGSGLGDLGWAVKWRRDLGPKAAVAIVTALTAATGDATRELGAGRALGSLTAVLSADLAGSLHFDLNTGPAGIGAGTPQWFTSAGVSREFGPWGVAFELYDFTAGGLGAAQRGLLGALLVTLAEWAVADAGGVLGLGAGSPDQLFLGLTTNLGRIFK